MEVLLPQDCLHFHDCRMKEAEKENQWENPESRIFWLLQNKSETASGNGDELLQSLYALLNF
jgi:hypothetical protein